MCRPPAASATPTSSRPSWPAFTGRELRAATGWRRCAPTATASTPSSQHEDPNSPVAGAEPFPQTPARAAMKASGFRRSSACPAIASRVLHGQLSRPGRRRRLGGGRQLLELPRRAQHPALERPPFHHQPRQPWRHLRPMPQGRDAEVHADARAPRTPAPRPGHRFHRRHAGCGDLRAADRAGHRRHVPAQPDHLAQQAGGTAARASGHGGAHDPEPALAAPGAAHAASSSWSLPALRSSSPTPGSRTSSAWASICAASFTALRAWR